MLDNISVSETHLALIPLHALVGQLFLQISLLTLINVQYFTNVLFVLRCHK
jgi:hypothetical protein